MADQDAPREGPIVDPPLGRSVLVIPQVDPHADKAFEARVVEQLVAIDRADRKRRTAVQKALGSVWRAWAVFWGLMAIAMPLAYLVVRASSGDQSVVRALSGPRVEDRIVHPGGILVFTQDMERLESCPGEVVEVFAPADDRKDSTRPVELIQQRRAAQNLIVKVFADVRQVTQVPASIAPGLWRFTWSVESRCALRQRIDTIATFDIEVRP